MKDLIEIMETALKIKNAQLNCLANQIEEFKSIIDNLDIAIECQLKKEDLIMNELAKEGYSVNFSKDENGEVRCNLIKEKNK